MKFGLPNTLKHEPTLETWAAIEEILPTIPEEHRWRFFVSSLPETLKHKPTPEKLKQTWATIAEILPTIPEEHLPSFFNRLPKVILRNPAQDELEQMVANAKDYLEGHPGDYFFGKVVAENFGRIAPPEGKFNRLSFEKTGMLIPLGGRDKGGIIRIIRPNAFEAWKKAYEDSKLRRHVEPILEKNGKLRAYVRPDGTYRVYTRYAGTRVPDYLIQNPGKKSQVETQQQKIRLALYRLGIDYGPHQTRHDHDGNFTVETVNGKPVVKLIDFDLATVRT
ncbi:MAG: hypothetical protein WC607_03700 [Candidatus Micrarchaeia archaeon]